ncbi:MAG: SRPBCC domain-containing protein [Burkholderiaceae bacterium]|nr:SRPBCC domain-containing protein [Burkholderiaceae bacterium]
MIDQSELDKDTSEREFVITRVVAAPREQVFHAWTDPVQLAQWWGPHDFTNPVCEVDLRVGGAYRIVMRGPDGTEYPIKGEYGQIAAPARLVMTDNWEEHPDQWREQLTDNHGNAAEDAVQEALDEVTFEAEQGGWTRLTIRTIFSSGAVRDAMLKMGMTEGWSQSLERLSALVAKK